mmetsp:Transcript_24882/g.36700  ORF Transcript_24882/g.36700 Transcript_24882/m.36700 type:complete len:503 (+) Transcript_24882:70-1578(+)
MRIVLKICFVYLAMRSIGSVDRDIEIHSQRPPARGKSLKSVWDLLGLSTGTETSMSSKRVFREQPKQYHRPNSSTQNRARSRDRVNALPQHRPDSSTRYHVGSNARVNALLRSPRGPRLNETEKMPPCRVCNNWLIRGKSNSNPTRKGMIFLHMRKSGGTMFLHHILQWLLRKRCVSYKSLWNYNLTAVGGIHNSHYYVRKLRQVRMTGCNELELRQVEYTCLNGPFVLSLPRREQRRHIALELFTIIRDPIERIVSQAFYVGPGKSLVNKKFDTLCRKTTICRNSSLCIECRRNATSIAANEMKTAESTWFEWLKSAHGFGEKYMPNYFIKRLTAGIATSTQKSDNAIALKCLETILNSGPQGVPVYSSHSCASSIDMLSALVSPSVNSKTSLNEQELEHHLEMAKKILEEHFDFIIMELFDADWSRVVLKGVLGEHIPVDFSQRANVGDIAPPKNSPKESHYYRKFLPDSVLQYLIKENAADLKFYEFAVDLFKRRMKGL